MDHASNINNLKPFTDATRLRAAVAISNCLGYNGRQLVKKYRDTYKPQMMLDIIENNYKPKGPGLNTEYVRNLCWNPTPDCRGT